MCVIKGLGFCRTIKVWGNKNWQGFQFVIVISTHSYPLPPTLHPFPLLNCLFHGPHVPTSETKIALQRLLSQFPRQCKVKPLTHEHISQELLLWLTADGYDKQNDEAAETTKMVCHSPLKAHLVLTSILLHILIAFLVDS